MSALKLQSTNGNPTPTKFGITDPISLALPTPHDLKLSKELEKALHGYGLYESTDESEKREEVLGRLTVIVNEWVKKVCKEKGFESLVPDVTAKIFTSGSYRLGVHGPGSDIDTLCVAPKVVDREDFFSSLFEMLSKNTQITELTAIPDAFVPIIKLKFNGIAMDLLFARFGLSTLPDDLNLLDHSNLKNFLDEKSITSLNGCRVSDQILKLVPNSANFRIALRCIKFWGKKRGVYSNVVGFLGGVSWALLVARICQLYPNASPNILVSRFFRIYEQWKWPNPVLLNTITEDATLSFKVWNPKTNFRDGWHLMPIITPAYPAQNSTYNVSQSTLHLLQQEFQRGAQLTFQIENEGVSWSVLFEESDFFSRYKAYVQLEIIAATEEEHRKWEGWVESKLRFLILNLEQTQNLQYAHPYPAPYSHPPTDKDSGCVCSSFFLGLNLTLSKAAGPKIVDLTPAVGEFTQTINQWAGKLPSMEIKARHLLRSQLPDYVFEGIRPKPKRKSLKSKGEKHALQGDALTNSGKRIKTEDGVVNDEEGSIQGSLGTGIPSSSLSLSSPSSLSPGGPLLSSAPVDSSKMNSPPTTPITSSDSGERELDGGPNVSYIAQVPPVAPKKPVIKMLSAK